MATISGWHIRLGFMAAIVTVLATGCATTQKELNAVWDWSSVAIPAGAGPDEFCNDATYRVGDERGEECIAKITGPRPLVIFLHGCSGAYQPHYIDLLRKLGYVVVAPNSMINGRQAVCPSNLGVVALRIDEAKTVIKRSQAWSWVDRSRIVLAGFSEGAVATAHYDASDLHARVILGWTCQSVAASWAGYRGKEPALAIVADRDPWHPGGNAGDCGPYLRDERSRSVVIRDSNQHDVLVGAPDVTVKELKNFLETVLRVRQ